MCYNKSKKENLNCLECSMFYECNSKYLKTTIKTKIKLFSIKINKKLMIFFEILKFKIQAQKYKFKSKYYEIRNIKIIKKYNLRG